MPINITSLFMTIDDRTIFSNISLVVPSGKITALVGPSGCGKTTLLNCSGGLLQPTSGGINFDGTDITQLKEKEKTLFWRDKVSFIYQDYGIIDDATVSYNVDFVKTIFPWQSRKIHRKTREALAIVGLEERAKDKMSFLSGGEKQRVAIARAIRKNSPYILADEPTASLDSKNKEIVLSLFRRQADLGCTILLATHDDFLINRVDNVFEWVST
ncbi:ABC transporter ATP-binding protein [Actinotignum urinale]|uniref:ABC transporter ATP-binding protein n=1 Tax=Actinotignum urinale TaxID=190146 RepID=UPI00280B89E3|nr:ABC transporter ATP-binding protein [Actinotignum urinale]